MHRQLLIILLNTNPNKSKKTEKNKKFGEKLHQTAIVPLFPILSRQIKPDF